MFVFNSDITIGDFRFSGVNEVRISRSIYSIVEKAIIRIPSIAKIVKEGVSGAESVITGNQFKDGDKVVIKLGYNGDLKTEFTGYVNRRNLDMPLEVECEGNSWLLRRNSITKFWKSISVKELLTEAVNNLPGGAIIDIQCDTDFLLTNVSFNYVTGFDIVNSLKRYTDGNLVCFFIQPNVLWCGVVFTQISKGNDEFGIGNSKYRLGLNAIKSNNLKQRFTNNDVTEVKYNKRMSTGELLSQTSDVFKMATKTYSETLNHISESSALKMLANEKALSLNYSGYEGCLYGFLQPFSEPAYTAFINDTRYPESDGNFLVESTAVEFGIKGARRVVEIGARIGFANNI